MHKRNPEILRFEVALQDFAEFTVVIHYEQMRPELLGRPTGNFGCVRAACALIVHDDSDESLLNQERPAQTNRNEKIVCPTVLCRVAVNHTMQFRAGRSPTIRCSARPPEHAAASSGYAKASVNAAEPTKQEGVYFFGQRPPLRLKLSSHVPDSDLQELTSITTLSY